MFWRRKRKQVQKELHQADDRGWTRIFDFKPGAWQSDAAYPGADSVLAYPAVFACISLISGDIAKLKPLLQVKAGDIWRPADTQGFEVLTKPNSFQNHIRFKQSWVESKLIHGNAYALKQRTGNRITALYLLDPLKVTPLVSDGGEVFYRLRKDNLVGVKESEVTVPAREIIHDRWNCLHHPLVGLPPVYASATAGRLGLAAQANTKAFFSNDSNPGGLLLAPGNISDTTATRLKEYWESKFSGKNSGKLAVLGDNLKYEAMRMSAVDAQLIETLRWTAETVCSTFHVPGYMIGVGQMPTHNNIEALTAQYYTQCLQVLIEDMEAALDEGLGVPTQHRVQLDLDGLFRMDSVSMVESLARAVGAGILAPDEARARLNYGTVPGGKYPYLQQQNYSLEALANRQAPRE